MTTRQGRQLFSLTALGGAVMLGGCDLDNVLDPIYDLEGAYELFEVDGRRPPFELDTFDDGAWRCRVDLVSGSMVLEENRYGSNRSEGFYEVQWAFRETCTNGGQTQVDYPVERETGQFSTSGTTIYFEPDQGAISDFDGRLSGERLTIDRDGSRIEYREDDDF